MVSKGAECNCLHIDTHVDLIPSITGMHARDYTAHLCLWEKPRLTTFYNSKPTVESAELWGKVCGSQTIGLTCVGVE